eukprot:SAG11_NODE_1038_length_6076_cov_4.857454_9_plen_109_part_00
MAQLQLHAGGNRQQLFRPCEWCGLRTGNFCETLTAPRATAANGWQGGVCLAAARVPDDQWQPNQRTPICTACEAIHTGCPFCCRADGQPWANVRHPQPALVHMQEPVG